MELERVEDQRNLLNCDTGKPLELCRVMIRSSIDAGSNPIVKFGHGRGWIRICSVKSELTEELIIM